MSIKADIRELFRPYYLYNLLLSLSYVILKRLPGVCNYLFHVDECEFDGRETEILFFLIIVVMIRTRKAGSVSMINYLSSSFVYTKVANLILWFNADFLMGIIYGIVFILGALIFPEPTYSGPDNVIYFRGLAALEEEFSKTRDGYWLITFYAAWNPGCVNYAPIFAKLSTEYRLENLSFGKIDVGRFPEAAKKFHVSDSSMSKQLPTTVLFKQGKEIARRPTFDNKGTVAKFLFSAENVRGAFDLNNLYDQCRNTPKSKGSHVKTD